MAGEDEPRTVASSAAEARADQIDPSALMRSRQYRRLLVGAAVIGLVVSVVSWAFLEFTHLLQEWVYTDLPEALGFHQAPWWWPLPVLLVAGLIIAFAVVRLPGHGGHEPSNGLTTGTLTTPAELPGVISAAFATIGLGLVLGPEAPLMAIAGGVAVFLIRLSRRQVPDQATQVLGAAASFAALSTVFGSPIIGAVIVLEAAGLAGTTLTVVLLPGLIAAGIGSLAFVGLGSLSGLSTEAYAMPPLHLPTYPTPTLVDFLWTIPLAVSAAIVVFAVFHLAKMTKRIVAACPFVLVPTAALLVGGLAILFAQVSGKSAAVILFSGEQAMADVLEQSGTVSLGLLVLLLGCKAVAWAISMGAARGGPTFPAIFLGLVGGLLASHIPSVAQAPAIAVLVGAAVVSVLKLPLASIVLAVLTSQGGAGVVPLIIVGVVIAHIATLVLTSPAPRGDPETSAAEPLGPAPTAER
jgi:chloride channel protein, CIC family